MVQIMPLNDHWIFTKTNNPTYVFESIQDGQSVTLPHSWNDTDGQGGSEKYFRGQCWYQRILDISHEDLTKRIYLEIGAAGNMGHVYVNGNMAGESRCGYAMFRVPLTPYLKEGGNLITIMVDNGYDSTVFPLMADFTFYGGLYREMSLLVMDEVHFDLMDNGRDGVYLTQRKISPETFELDVHGQIVNESSVLKEGSLQIQVRDEAGKTVLEASSELALGNEAKFSIKSEVANPILWDGVDQPYLYTVEVSVLSEGQVCDSRIIAIGFRTVEATTEQGLLLNGKPVKINGVCRHQDFAGVGNAITKTHMDEDMALIREIGANSLRLAHYQHDDYFYSLCDRYGLLVWAEIPFISIPSTKDPENHNAEEQLEKLIKQAYNHCSIYCWGIQNEITIAVETEQTYKTIRKLEVLAKHLDPNRLTVQANINGVENNSIINSFTDLIGYNLYYGWYYGEIKDLQDRLDEFHRAQPKIPIIVSEYGVDTNPKYHSYTPQVQDYTEEYQLLFHQNALETFDKRTFVLGGYVWNMFDFGSANRNEGGETGKNLKGLVTIDRKIKKDAFYLYKAYWSKNPFVHLAGRRFVNRHQEHNDIVILSNLHHLKVYLNQTLITEINSREPMKIVKDVSLIAGENCVIVEGTDEYGVIHTEEIVLHHAAEIDRNYIHVKPEKEKNVVNWFEKFDLSNAETIELRDGYFSTFDTIEDLYSNEEAKAVFLKYFEHVTNNPFFEVTKDVISIEKMAQLTFYNIPPELIPVINKELNAIQK
ncbi:glycoside hydrolase family 2 protein [Paenibacillus alginolyticus]|uniref:Glycosyl hydrolase n=1 Tax=Paenibacillus alginolyticus TaxID=59839 RepID=A0ABT4G5J1_9BACL|nr:glycoside hydrolase family 2 TIM barrel-domain containing protein [Paenibacillus alginolyticus]MCY9691430.1 glycosyl hydrolase [Paenibacillus alginolyticus]MEC0146538.1 glycoside hydrolase family 2 TIM barrel-domain containing protein [Paenibacillus alginolyticus]